MKKYIFTILCILLAVATNAQDVMVIEKNDNTTAKFSVDDIRRVYFENSGGPVIPPTSNSQLTCRLKDKDGNPVLLAGIKFRSNDEWLFKFDYDQNGNLVSIVSRYGTYNVNGLNITGQEINDDIENYDIQLKLNEAGLISGYSVTEKEYYRATGNMKKIASAGSVSLSYDSDNQLIEVRSNGYQEKYNEDGTLKKIEEIQTESVYTWSEENLISIKTVSREKENGEWTEKTYTEGPIKYGSGINVTRQQGDIRVFEGPFEGLCYLGLFGVGSKNFVEKTSYTLNSNGTVDTVGSHKYIYK